MQRAATLRAVKFAKSHKRRKFGGKKRDQAKCKFRLPARMHFSREHISLGAVATNTHCIRNSPIRKLKYTGHSLTRQSRMFIVF